MHATDPKNDSIRVFIKGTNADIVGLAEMGICWHRLPTKYQIVWERTRGWFETLKTVVGYNQQEKKPKPVQWGGMAIWSINNTAHRATESGCNPLGLGRWSWTRYRGKGNVTLWVISAYHPCDSNGPLLTAYIQHQNHFDEKDIEGCAGMLFIQHLLGRGNRKVDRGRRPDHINDRCL
jgi:hypothetical protein